MRTQRVQSKLKPLRTKVRGLRSQTVNESRGDPEYSDYARNEVGRASLKIRDLMRLTQGSVVELDRLAGEPLDIVVNDTVVAQGEVVLVNDRYGVRLTKVVSAADRIKKLVMDN